MVFSDNNQSGLQNAGEAGIAGVVITLTGTNGTTFQTVTSSGGAYTFTNLPADVYVVTVGDGPEGTVLTTAQTLEYIITNGTTHTSANFGYAPVSDEASVSGLVWYDLDNDGVRDAGEVGIIAVEVVLAVSYTHLTLPTNC